MALTIQSPQAPNGWRPSGNDLYYSLTSDQTAQSGFYYLIDVQINDITVITLRKYPVTGATINVNVREIIDSYITTQFFNGGQYMDGVVIFPTDFLKCVVIGTEFYNGQTYATATTPPIYIWNAAAPFDVEQANQLNNYERNFINYIQSGNVYLPRPMGYNSFISPNDLIVNNGNVYATTEALSMAYPTNRHWQRPISFLCLPIFLRYAVFLGLDSEGKAIKKYVRPTNVQNNSKIITAIFGGGLLASNFPVTFAAPGTDVSNMNDCSYIVFYYAENYTDLTDNDKIYTKPVIFQMGDCSESFGILYKSFEGGFNMVQCNRRATQETNIETITRENIKPLNWSTDTRLISTANVNAAGKWVLNTDWVTESINKDINDMIQSPLIWIMHYKDGQTQYIPVTLINANYTTKQYNDVNLFNYSFEFAEAYFKNTIRQ